MELPEQVDEAEAVLASGDRARISKLLERFFPKGAVLILSQDAGVATCGHAPGGHPHALGMVVTSAQTLGQQIGCSVMFMQGLNLQEQEPKGLVLAKETPKGLPLPTDPNWRRELRRHG